MGIRLRTAGGRWSLLAFVTCIAGLAACNGGGGGGGATVVSVSGTTRDWKTGAVVGNASIRSVGIAPEVTGESDAAGAFTLEGIPINGYVIFDVSAVGYARTHSPAILVEEQALGGVVLETIAQGDAAALQTGFGVTGTNGHGNILGGTRYADGAGIAGVAVLQILPVTFDAAGPYFLGSGGTPATGATQTTADGGFVFFNVSTGNVAVQAAAAGFVFLPTASVIRNGAWSLAYLTGDGSGPGGTPTPTPTGTPPPQSFAADVYPIFAAKGCSTQNACHKSGNPGGNFRLDQAANQIHAAVFARVNLATPDQSLMLTKPLFEAVPNHGGGNIFLTNEDPDYKTILYWIQQGAENN